MTDPRIARLRRFARAHGWHVSRIAAAPTKRRAAIDLVCQRILYPAWATQPNGTMVGHAVWERIEVNVDSFGGGLIGNRSIDGRRTTPPTGWLNSETNLTATLAKEAGGTA